MMRMTRAAILNVMQSAYIETAELKGLRPIEIIRRHAFPNAIAPIVNVVMLNLAFLIVGVVVVEVIFVYPGMGQYLVDHVAKRDVPVVQAVRPDLRRRLHRLEHRRRHRRDRRQSAASASEMRARMLDFRRIPIGAWIGLILTALFLFVAVFAPLIAPYRHGRDRRRRLGADARPSTGSAPTISAATSCRA